MRSCGLWGVVCTDQDWMLFILSLASLALALLWEFTEEWRAREWPRALDPEASPGAPALPGPVINGMSVLEERREVSSRDPSATGHGPSSMDRDGAGGDGRVNIEKP